MKKLSSNKILLTFWQHAWRYPPYVIGILINIPLTSLVYQFLPPLILANVLNRLSKGDFQPHHVWASFGTSLVTYIVLLVLGGAVGYRITDYLSWRLEANVERDLARHVFQHLLQQGADFHANRFGGSLVSQTNKLMASYVRFSDTTVYQFLPLISALVWTSVIMAKRAPLFTVLLLSFSILYMISSVFVTRKVRRLSAAQASAESAQTGNLADAVTNVMAIKSFAGSQFEKQRFARTTSETREHTLAIMRGSQKQMIYFSTVNSLISGLALVMAVIGVMIFKANLATVFLILSYTSTIVSQLFTFSNNTLKNYNRAFGDASDMVTILQIEPEIKDPDQPQKSRIRQGAITFRNVTFTHSGVDEALFHDLNVDIKAGEKIGLVGHSGSGKTTFTRVLLRFSDLDGGQILIDRQDITRITQDDLHRHIAYVPQEPIMFHRSLGENIGYGKFEAPEKAIIAAAKVAHAHEFITQLPQGYDTLVGERGVKLSGGQRQRVAIARAMLKNAPILVLDEATSALDSESEVLIQDALWKLMEGRTAIVIAHRLSTIQKMDRIIVLDDGAIVEQGTHKELLRAKGTYAKLWAHQSGGFMDD